MHVSYKRIKIILMNWLELRIPPLVVVLIFAALIRVIALVAPAPILFPGQLSVATTFALFGAIISLAGVVAFRYNKTTVNPFTPDQTSSLVTTGIYRISRNPMYLGFLLILSGWAIYLGNWVTWILLPTYVAYMNYFQIQPEERALINRFGGHFLSYCNKVRRWV